MSTYSFVTIEEIKGKIAICKLVKDGFCEFDAFCTQIKKESNLSRQLAVIQSRLEDIANLRLLPAKKFKDITPRKETVKEYG